MTTHSDESALRRALDLAARGPATGVNPQVGCIILSPTGDLLAEGWHRGAGTPHAEIDALAQLTPEQARGATAIVTLEPCNTWGRTGPCTEALIAAGIARVGYGVADPGPSAGGAARLEAADVVVTPDLCSAEATEFLRRWLTAMRHARPHVTLKWASTLDGRAAASDGTSQWITGAAARTRVHEQRAAVDAIIVGSGTVAADNPSLTARGDGGQLLTHQPIPVVLGDRPIPADAALHRHPHAIIHLPGHNLRAALTELFDRNIRSVLVEGGPTLASAFVAEHLVDDYTVYLAPALLGGPLTALHSIGVGTIDDAVRLHLTSVEIVGTDVLITARAEPRPLPHPASPIADPQKEK